MRFDLHRAAQRPPQQFDHQREEQAEHKAGRSARSHEKRTIGPIRLIGQARRLDQRQPFRTLFAGHALAGLRPS